MRLGSLHKMKNDEEEKVRKIYKRMKRSREEWKKIFKLIIVFVVFLVLSGALVLDAIVKDYHMEESYEESKINQAFMEYITKQEEGYMYILRDIQAYIKDQGRTEQIAWLWQLASESAETTDDSEDPLHNQLEKTQSEMNTTYGFNCIGIAIETQDQDIVSCGSIDVIDWDGTSWENGQEEIWYRIVYDHGQVYMIVRCEEPKEEVNEEAKDELTSTDEEGYLYIVYENINSFQKLRGKYTDLLAEIAYIADGKTMELKYNIEKYATLEQAQLLDITAGIAQNGEITQKKASIPYSDKLQSGKSKENVTCYIGVGRFSQDIYIMTLPVDQLRNLVLKTIFKSKMYIWLYSLFIMLGLFFGHLFMNGTIKNHWFELYYATNDHERSRMISRSREQLNDGSSQFHQDFESAIKIKEVSKIVLMFFDIQNFSIFQYTHELMFTELIAKKLSEFLQHEYPERYYWVGGDKFIITLYAKQNNISQEKLLEEARTVVKNVNNYFQEGLLLESSVAKLSCNCGIAIYPKDSVTSYELLQKAGMACYYGKEKTGKQTAYYDSCMSYELNWKNNLYKYLREVQNSEVIRLSGQDTYRLEDGRISYTKIGVKVKKPLEGELSFRELLNLNEEMGIGEEILWNVVKRLCQYIKIEDEAGRKRPYAVNLSTTQFLDDQGMKKIINYVRQQGVDYRRIWFEIYEIKTTKDYDELAVTLLKYKEMGMHIICSSSLSTGSGNAYTCNFPIHGIKLDSILLKKLEGSKQEYEYAEAVILAIKTLSVTVIADGVDDEIMKQQIIQCGIDQARGKIFSEAYDLTISKTEEKMDSVL